MTQHSESWKAESVRQKWARFKKALPPAENRLLGVHKDFWSLILPLLAGYLALWAVLLLMWARLP